MTGKDLIQWEAKFRTLTALQDADKSKKQDQFGAEMPDTMAEAEEAEKESFLQKSGGYIKGLVARDVTELAAISTLVLFSATILEKLISPLLKRSTPRRARR